MARCCGFTPLKSARREQCYSFLSRNHNNRNSSIGQSQSTDNSNHSVKEDSYSSQLIRESAPHLTRFNSSRIKNTSITEVTELDATSYGQGPSESNNICRENKNDTYQINKTALTEDTPRQSSVLMRLRPPTRRKRLSDFRFWNVLRCVQTNRRPKKLQARYYIEAASLYEMTFYGQPTLFRCTLGSPRSNISNSSLKVWDDPALQDELNLYMRNVIEEVRV